MFANRLVVLFVVTLIAGIYLTYQVDESWFFLIAVGLVLSVSTYVLSPQLNWWWWQRFPPDLPKAMGDLLEQRHPFYAKLSAADKQKFRSRVFLFNEGTSYMPQVMEKMPLDGKVMIAAAPVTFTFGEEEFRFPQFENVVVYPHPFPSPQLPDHFHASEIYEPDGVVMFCMEHVLRGFIDPGQGFNPSWYEYAKVFQLSYPAYDYGDWSGVSWADMEAISGFSYASLKEWFGLPELDITPMGIAFFFLFPASFKQQLPALFLKLDAIFNQK